MNSFVRFDSKNVFLKNLSEGINLFLGAGFSIEAEDRYGSKLPTGNVLMKEIKNKFSKVEKFPDLSKASTVLEATTKEEFYTYLKERFTVFDYNPKYNVLRDMKLKSIYTTNIDNLIFNIFANSTKSFLNNTAIRGSSYGTIDAVNYFPLHGCVLNPEKGYIFSKTKIASAYIDSQDDWSNLRNSVISEPILFWGWSFDDSDAIEALYSKNSIVNENYKKWIVLYEPEDYEIEFYTALNFNIVISDTLNMLDYLSEAIISQPIVDNTITGFFPEYSPPLNDTKLGSYPLQSFFEGDAPRWSQIYSGGIKKTHWYSIICDHIAANRNIFVIGMPASGKTTLMMQILCDYQTDKHKHFLSAPSKEQIELYLNRIGTQSCILFIDDCFRDVNIIFNLMRISNIQLVAFDRDYVYESQAYRLRNENFTYEVCDITEIDQYDARKIIDSVSNEIKKNRPSIDISDATIFTLLSQNLKGQRFEKRFANMVNEFYNVNPISTELFIMICYVHACGVPVSFDMLYSYLREVTADYKEMYKIIDNVGNIIKECSDDTFGFLNINFKEQDYFQSRSRYFAELIISNLPAYPQLLSKVLLTFSRNISPSKICRYDIFKRRGYDADYTTKAFSKKEDGLAYYELCTNIDESEYLFQQAALYFNRKREYNLAFEWIDKAKNLANYNRFSIDNTHAIIQFTANINAEDSDGSVLNLLTNSLDTLKNCYNNDRRKMSHVKAFASFAIEFYTRFGSDESLVYLEEAYTWIQKEKDNIDCGRKMKNEIRSLYEQIGKLLKR